MNIDVIRGDTVNIQFEIDSDTVLDLSSENFNVTFSLKRAATDTAYVFQKDKTAVTSIADNTFILRVAPEDTEDLIPGYYYYDLQIQVGDDTYTIALGKLQLIRDITLPPAVLPTFVYPDVNGDGLADDDDVMLIIKAYTNIQFGKPSGLTPEQEDIADCNRDGQITSSDASLLSGFLRDVSRGLYSNNSAGWDAYMAVHYPLQG